MAATWRSGSGPHVMASATSSMVTLDDACSKWAGIGSSWDSSPCRPAFGQSSNAVLRAASSSGCQHW